MVFAAIEKDEAFGPLDTDPHPVVELRTMIPGDCALLSIVKLTYTVLLLLFTKLTGIGLFGPDAVFVGFCKSSVFDGIMSVAGALHTQSDNKIITRFFNA